MKRRHYVVATMSSISVSLTGCVGSDLGGSSSNGDSDGSPEDVVKTFFDAAADGDTETQQELIHEETGVVNPIGEELNLISSEAAAVTLEDIAEANSRSVSEDEIERKRDAFEELTAELDDTGYAIVSYRIEIQERDAMDGYVILTEHEGEWMIVNIVNTIGFEQESSDPVSAPQIAFQYDFKTEHSLTIIHGGGDTIESSVLTVVVGETDVLSDTNSWDVVDGWQETIGTGDQLTLRDSSETDHSGETVRVIWNHPEGESSNTVSKVTWPA